MRKSPEQELVELEEAKATAQARMYIRRMICQHGAAHMHAFLKSLARGQTEPPSVFTVGPDIFFELVRDELSLYRALLLNPKNNPNNVTY